MINTNTTDLLLRVATGNPSGFTINITNFQPITRGWAVALLETQNCFGREGAERVIQVALEKTNGVVGGWFYENKFYFDAVMILESEAEATKLGIENQQIGIYNIETNFYKSLI